MVRGFQYLPNDNVHGYLCGTQVQNTCFPWIVPVAMQMHIHISAHRPNKVSTNLLS